MGRGAVAAITYAAIDRVTGHTFRTDPSPPYPHGAPGRRQRGSYRPDPAHSLRERGANVDLTTNRPEAHRVAQMHPYQAEVQDQQEIAVRRVGEEAERWPGNLEVD